MELKSIKLVGFKSFADSTIIPILAPLNAIVGPNGCGKSNIIDAIRWVIGEMSAKQLRGQSMSDVIFNGTASRKQVGKASVELLFDNKEGRLGGELAKYSEISVKREVVREGQSTYYLNGTACRRRDVVDVFLGTGLGPRSYAIIEQGMISRLIEAKPEEMRSYLEEAAGISKYKERRRDTENRIRRTQENLERVNDISQELATQLRRLKRQANAAKSYKVLKEEEHLLNAQIKALQWQQLEYKSQQHDRAIAEHQLRYDQRVSEQRDIEIHIEKSRTGVEAARDAQAVVQKDYYEQAAEIARLEQQIKTAEEQASTWGSELQQTNEMLDELQQGSSEQKVQIDELNAELDGLKPHADDIKISADRSEKELLEKEHAMRAWQDQWDSFQNDYANDLKQHEVAKTTITHLEQRLQAIASRLQELETTHDPEKLQEFAQEIEPLLAEATHIEDEVNQLHTELEALRHNMSQQRDKNNQLKHDLNAKHSELQQQQAALAALKARQQAALSDEANQAWLELHRLDKMPRLGQSIQVDSGWELAVETVLSDQLHALCINDSADIIAQLHSLSSGKLTVLERSATPLLTTSTKAKRLLDYIECEWPLQAWLNDVYAVETLEQALALRDTLTSTESVVSADGVWLGCHWMRVAKTSDSSGSVILREQKISDLKREIAALEIDLAAINADMEQGEAQLASYETAHNDKHQRFSARNKELIQAQTSYSAKHSRYQEQLLQQQRVLKECEDKHEEQQQLLQQKQEMAAQLEQTQQRLTDLNSNKQARLERRDQLRDLLNSTREHAKLSRQKADEFDIRVTSNENQLQVLQQAISRSERQTTQLKNKKHALLANLEQQDSPMDGYRQQLQQQLSKHIELEQHLQESSQQLAALQSAQSRHEKQKDVLLKTVNNFKDELQTLNMKKQEVTVRQSTVTEQLRESDCLLEKVLIDMPEEAGLSAWQEQLSAVELRISRLGPINLGAIDEHLTLTERKTYLDKQHEDLMEALSLLDNAMRKIDRETRTRFKETFDKVNQGFNHLFPKVFGGGRAILELQENDLLTAGVVVKAQPPGKRNTTIHMLSGGEKALTAIALVFSMFQLNPAPFCILDEVDASLDDVNVGRFCNLVREMSRSTQFLVISHNKVTIEIADRLMGVTMHEAGVSRIVTVDMQQAIEMAEA